MSMISLALAAALSGQVPPPAPAPGAIVVTGRRAPDYRAALEACLARNCPPNEDIDATMALAESLFVDGEYREARTALRQSIGRNRRHMRAFPEPVSDLYRANARVARSLGMDRDAEYSTVEILRVLQAGLPAEDHRHLTARFEMAQALVAFGQYERAIRMFRDIAERGRTAGRDDVVARAELRQLWAEHLLEPRDAPPSSRLLAMARSSEQHRAIGARMMLVRIHSERGDTAAAERLIAELGRSGRGRQLLYSPPYELAQGEDVEGIRDRIQAIHQEGLFSSNLRDRLVDNVEDKWIDVGFWVRPDGRVEGLEILRRRNETSWSDPLLESIRGRRYAASTGGSTYRLERYTYTAGIDDMGRATRVQTRSPRARVEYFDLSETEANARSPERPAS